LTWAAKGDIHKGPAGMFEPKNGWTTPVKFIVWVLFLELVTALNIRRDSFLKITFTGHRLAVPAILKLNVP
jgi:hypothetical protein